MVTTMEGQNVTVAQDPAERARLLARAVLMSGGRPMTEPEVLEACNRWAPRLDRRMVAAGLRDLLTDNAVRFERVRALGAEVRLYRIVR